MVIRGILLVFVDNLGNFGTTDVAIKTLLEIILVYQIKDYVQRLMFADLQHKLYKNDALVIMASRL